MVNVSNEKPEHGDDLARRLVWCSSVAWTVDRPRAQGARPVRAAVVGGGLGEPTPYNGCRGCPVCFRRGSGGRTVAVVEEGVRGVNWAGWIGRLIGRRRGRRSCAQSLGRDELPMKGQTRQQGPKARPVPLGLQLHLPPRAQRDLLQEEAGRGQGPPPGGDRPGPEEGRRPLGDAARRADLQRAPSSSGLTNASGCVTRVNRRAEAPEGAPPRRGGSCPRARYRTLKPQVFGTRALPAASSAPVVSVAL